MTQNKLLENSHKFVFLCTQYPQHNLAQIISLMTAMPDIDINVAIWYAQEAGYVEKNPVTDKPPVILQRPEKWEFGEQVQQLEDFLVYAFNQLAKEEKDLEDNFLGTWTRGYNPLDVVVAMRDLLDRKVLASYDLVDPKDLKSTYTFYSLYENGEQMWGRKSFKEQPTGEEKPESAPDLPAEE